MSDVPARCDGTAGCVTCSDAAEPMLVEAVSDDGAIAICVSETGEWREVLCGLLAGLEPGALVLVHAGAALQRVDGGAAEQSAR